MEWLENCIGRQSEEEIIDLQDSWVNIEVEQILSRKDRKRLRKKWVKSKRTHSKKPSVRKDRSVNRHHLINRCKWWTDNLANIKEMDIRIHAGLHQAFWNSHPHQILQQILEYCGQVLYPETKDQIIEEIQVLIDYYLKNEEFYNPLAFKSRVFIPRI